MNEELQNLNNIHLENVFEKHIVKCLVKEQEYIERNCLKKDREKETKEGEREKR